MNVIVGLGCRPGVAEADVRALLDTALGRHHVRIEDVLGYATVAARGDEPGLRAVAGPGLMTFSAAELAEVAVPNPSARVLESAGTASVAEAAALRATALLAPRGTRVHLIEPKLAGIGVTVALARYVVITDASVNPTR